MIQLSLEEGVWLRAHEMSYHVYTLCREPLFRYEKKKVLLVPVWFMGNCDPSMYEERMWVNRALKAVFS